MTETCAAVWRKAAGRPTLRCEKPPHDPASEHHFDGKYEVIWSSVPHAHFVGPTQFSRDA